MRKWLLATVAGICFIFLFIGGPSRFSPRSYRHAWDLGHIFSFCLWSYLSVNASKKLRTASFLRQCFWISLVTLIVGTLIELVQSGIGRTPSMGDVLKDVTGSSIALAFWIPSLHSIPKHILRIWQGMVILLLFVTLVPFVKAVADESIAKQQFPLLASFETPFEIERWEGNSEFTIDQTRSRHGHSSLKVLFNTDRYSGIFLVHFPGDWRTFSFLELNIFHQSSDSLNIHCRVHDRLHVANNLPYDDRFNSTFTLDLGWNAIIIPLEHVFIAPRSRTMDMANICSVGIFVANLTKPEVIYIDHVRLVR